jgi:predicted DsbA family dithiol-disulfide isomerase
MIHIDVVSDVICPWCFLGKRRLDKAIALLPDLQIEATFRPFFLDPTIPADGLDRHAYLANKFGEARLATLHDPLIVAGKADGVPYDFNKIMRTPNTLNAHRLLRWALQAGKQAAVAEALFMAYWHEGRDIGDVAVLAAIAADHGLDIRSDLLTDKDASAVLSEVHTAQQMGVTGVPTFIIARKYGVVGAQSAEVLVDAIRKAADRG